MKLVATALAVCLCSIVAGGTPARVSERDLDGLVGPVRSVTTYVAPIALVDGEFVAGDRDRESVEVFDDRGALVAQSRFSDGSVVERVAYRYDVDGAQLADARVRFGATVFSLVSTDAPAARPAAEWRTELSLTRYSIDERGLRLDAATFDRNGCPHTPIAREAYVRDDAGRALEVRRFTGDCELLDTTTFAYRPDGTLAELVVLRSDGSFDRRSLYSDYRFDGRGNWVARSEVETSGSGVALERRTQTRDITYREAKQRPAIRRAPQPPDSIASATRPRRVHPRVDVPDTDSDVEAAVIAFDLLVSKASDGDVVYEPAVVTGDEPGATRPRRVFPLPHDVAASDEPDDADSTDEPEPSDQPGNAFQPKGQPSR